MTGIQSNDVATSGRVSADDFSPLERRSMVTDTTRMLKQMIVDRRLSPGDRLPAERILCEALGVSRPTLREAIRALVAMNILVVQPGSGTFVSSLKTDELLEPFQFVLALARSNLDQLFEVRCTLEPAAAALAATRATDIELEALRDCVERTKRWRDDLGELLRLDVELHRLVVEATHNGIFINVVAGLTAMANASRRITVRIPGIAQHTAEDHVRIGTAIAERDGDRAALAMRDHLESLRARIRDHASEITLTAVSDEQS